MGGLFSRSTCGIIDSRQGHRLRFLLAVGIVYRILVKYGFDCLVATGKKDQEIGGNMNDSTVVSIQQSEKTLTATFLESKMNAIRIDNEPWETIEQSLQTSVPDKLVLDFANVNVICSSVLGKIVGFKKKFKGEIVITNLSDLLREVFQITGLNRLFTIQARAD